MKMIISFLMILAFATSAMAVSDTGGSAFQIYSAASAGVKQTSVFAVKGYKTKTVTMSGATITSNASAITYKNMSGTVVAQCAPTANGPWSTCVDNNYAQTAVSKTTNGVMSWSDAVAYIRLQWTASTIGTKIKLWLNWSE